MYNIFNIFLLALLYNSAVWLEVIFISLLHYISLLQLIQVLSLDILSNIVKKK